MTRRSIGSCALFFLALLISNPTTPSMAQGVIPETARERIDLERRIDASRVGVVTGGPGGTYVVLGSDLAKLTQIEHDDDLRTFVNLGRGSLGNIEDLIFAKYVDFALVQADVLDFWRRVWPREYDFLKDRVNYVAPFHPEIIHVLARGGLQGPEDLSGKTIAVGGEFSGSRITAEILFKEIFPIDAQFVFLDDAEALAKLAQPLSEQRGDNIDAMVYVAGRGSSRFANIHADIADGLREQNVLFVPFPTQGERNYSPKTLTADDYPDLVGDDVPVWAVPAVLAVYAWDPARNATHRDRYARTTRFVDTLFGAREKLAGDGFNENWCEMDLAGDLEGWKRYPPTERWVEAAGGRARICPVGCDQAIADYLAPLGLGEGDARDRLIERLRNTLPACLG